MAIDKNSQAYQSLLNSGYTDEQINQMHDSVASGQSAQSVIQGSETNRNLPGYDPMADLTPEYLANMDMNKQIKNANQSYSQYWDDSSRENQSTQWGLNSKYTWEWVKTSDVNYKENFTTKDLNPNFVYWKTSQVYGTDHPYYISQRNDDIASALYNEWRVSKEEVKKFLEAQKWFFDSSEEDRLNTIESVWKRLWAIAEMNREKPDPSKADQILTDSSGKLYWKVTAEEWNPSEWIDTLADANSALRAMEEARVANLKALINNSPADIAAMELSGISPFWEQTMRDARQYYPEFVAEIEAEKKKQLTQENVQAIASGWEVQTSADKVNTDTANTSYAVNNSSSSTSATQLLKWIDSILESSDTAKSAQELMGSIENDMAKLKNRLKNLRNEANAAFKWDVPDYIVNAYMNNKSQEIQNQLSILEDRYNAAYERYKTELSNAQWQAEYDLKKQSLALDEWKAKNWATWSSWTWVAKMRTERNNNPTAMSTDVAKMLWGVLGVDYEIWDSWTSADWRVYYTAKLIGDPIETTIRLIDRWIANGIDPFYRANWQGRWSYISKIGITKAKWQQMSPAEKAEIIKKMLQYEGGSMENMLYYTQQWWTSTDWTTWSGTGLWSGYDAELGYNPFWKDTYEKLLSENYTKWWIEETAAAKWITVQELQRQANNFALAKSKWLDVYDDWTRAVDETYWFILDKKPIYDAIIKANFKVPWTQQKAILQELWLNPNDPKAREKASSEAMKYQEYSKTNIDTRTSEILEALEYIIMQDAMKWQRSMMFWPWTTDENWNYVEKWWNKLSAEDDTYRAYYEYLRDNLTFDKLIELKKSWATFWALSNQELDAIATAASGIRWEKDDAAYRRAINATYKALREALGRWIDDSSLNWMWNAEEHNNFTNYIIIKQWHVTWPWSLWQWSYWKSNAPISSNLWWQGTLGKGKTFTSTWWSLTWSSIVSSTMSALFGG